MIAYIDENTKNWMNRETVCHGMDDIGVEVRLTDTDDPPFDYEGIYYGNTGYSHRVLTQLGYNIPPLAHVPEGLIQYSGRSVEEVSLEYALMRSRTHKQFIKPIPANHKRFTGLVIESGRDLLPLANYGMDERVLMSPAIDIVSEWRCFVHKKSVLGSRFYHGDFKISPNYYDVVRWAREWDKSPIAYSMDVGITAEGKTIIVECNDVLSLGWYGFFPTIAANMLVDRWDEIHSQHKWMKK